jgi:hypothetical protein
VPTLNPSESIKTFSKVFANLKSLTALFFDFWIYRGAPLGSSDQEHFRPGEDFNATGPVLGRMV